MYIYIHIHIERERDAHIYEFLFCLPITYQYFYFYFCFVKTHRFCLEVWVMSIRSVMQVWQAKTRQGELTLFLFLYCCFRLYFCARTPYLCLRYTRAFCETLSWSLISTHFLFNDILKMYILEMVNVDKTLPHPQLI